MNARAATPLVMGAVLLVTSAALSVGILMLSRGIPDARFFVVCCVAAPLAVLGGVVAGWMLRTALPSSAAPSRKPERVSGARGRQ